MRESEPPMLSMARSGVATVLILRAPLLAVRVELEMLSGAERLALLRETEAPTDNVPLSPSLPLFAQFSAAAKPPLVMAMVGLTVR